MTSPSSQTTEALDPAPAPQRVWSKPGQGDARDGTGKVGIRGPSAQFKIPQLLFPIMGVWLPARPSSPGLERDKNITGRGMLDHYAVCSCDILSSQQSPWPTGGAPGGEPPRAPAQPLQGPAAGSSSSHPTPPAGGAAALRPGSSCLGCQAPGCLPQPDTPQRREVGMSQGERQGRGFRRTGHGLSKGQGHRKEVKWSSLEGQVRKGLGGKGLGPLRLADQRFGWKELRGKD